MPVVFHSMTEGTLLSPEGVKFFKCLNKKYVASCPESLETFLPAAKQNGMIIFTENINGEKLSTCFKLLDWHLVSNFGAKVSLA